MHTAEEVRKVAESAPPSPPRARMTPVADLSDKEITGACVQIEKEKNA